MDFLCGKRSKAVLSETLSKMEIWGEIDVTVQTKEKLERISSATIDRMLTPERKRLELKSRSGTKPGTLLKSQIQIRTSADWDETKPGFAEATTQADLQEVESCSTDQRNRLASTSVGEDAPEET